MKHLIPIDISLCPAGLMAIEGLTKQLKELKVKDVHTEQEQAFQEVPSHEKTNLQEGIFLVV